MAILTSLWYLCALADAPGTCFRCSAVCAAGGRDAAPHGVAAGHGGERPHAADGTASFGRFHCIFSGPQVQRHSDAAFFACCYCCAAQDMVEGLQSRAALCSSVVRLLGCDEARWKLACVFHFACHIS